MDPRVENERAAAVTPGTRLRSQVCDTEVVVVRAPAEPVDLRCGGHPMVPAEQTPSGGTLDDAFAGGTVLGKRYGEQATGLQVLCTKAGDGSLSIGDTPLAQVDTKGLPSSD